MCVPFFLAGAIKDAPDAPAVRRIKQEAAPANYTFASLVQGIVTSIPFQMRMPDGTN